MGMKLHVLGEEDEEDEEDEDMLSDPEGDEHFGHHYSPNAKAKKSSPSLSSESAEEDGPLEEGSFKKLHVGRKIHIHIVKGFCLPFSFH